ncbi:sugar transporter [Cordyceps fumosorosea ARSEF 2679]|uniref:Sugar transporter n=1 Tax=Cordyceps fumosorosea (strain ARSEF 2679) TaxID=1081104 RepID=A0A162LES5_CORFA|nr:sugar transporter [Cordyceps fumosorosea ARSEF 2679]OAA69624.1 sugar transporter [Cordyceps fumosorosea ARSEF 2679]
MRITWGLGLGRVESVDHYAGVLVPLEEAHLHSHSARTGRVEFEARDFDLDDDDDDETGARKDRGDEEERAGMLEMDAAEYSIHGLRKAMRDGRGGGAQWSEYEIKSKLINKAVQDIGMGTYNWQLFVLCGFGWFADNLWLQGVSLTLPSLSAEFGVDEKTVRYTTSACFVGLSAGSFLWGIGSDFLGRRIAFNMTLLITSVFGVMAAYAQTWAGVCFFFAAFGFGVGGNLPVDGALFLEFLPDASSSLLTLLSVWWPIGQLVSSLAAWYFIANWPVEQGWRYFIVTIGIATFAMFIVRFFVFHLLESPKFLLNKGRQNEAVAVIHGLAYRNGCKTWLTSEILDEVAAEDYQHGEGSSTQQEFNTAPTKTLLTTKLKGFSADRIRPLFQNKTLGLATALVWFCWASIGMGYPLFNAFLPQYFARTNGAAQDGSLPSETSPISAETYRNYAITSVMGVPGSLLAAYLVDHPSPFLGRRGTLAGSTLLSAIFLFFFVLFGTTPTAQLFFSCVEAFSQNIMYGVLYAFTPEIFPAPVRGAGSGMASFLNRVTGLMAPLLAANMPGDSASGPIYLSAVLILSAFVAMCLIPIETRGAQRL